MHIYGDRANALCYRYEKLGYVSTTKHFDPFETSFMGS